MRCSSSFVLHKNDSTLNAEVLRTQIQQIELRGIDEIFDLFILVLDISEERMILVAL